MREKNNFFNFVGVIWACSSGSRAKIKTFKKLLKYRKIS
jgi:hypothetical protein